MKSENTKQTPPTIQAKQKNKHMIFAEIVFGDPKQTSCGGTGICRLFPQKLRLSPDEISVSVRFVFLQNGSMRMQIRRSDLPEGIYCRQFAGKQFTVRTEVKWPRWMQGQLPAQAHSGIAPGVYTCLEYDRELVICF